MKTSKYKNKITKEEFEKLKDDVSNVIIFIKKFMKDSSYNQKTISELSRLKFNDCDKKVIYDGDETERIKSFIPKYLLEKKGRIK